MKFPNFKKNNSIPVILLGAIIITLIAIGTYLYLENQKTKKEIEELKNPESYAEILKEENKVMISDIGEHLLLPSDETPTIYTITDIAHAQAAYGDFFKDAKDGDKLIMYEGKAIIYRDESDIIVNVGPVIYVTPEK